MRKTEDRELRITKSFNAPLELVWDAWAKPEHIANWWGPDGFTNTIDKMDFEEGGEWKFTMHGPNGTNFPNRSIFKKIIPFKKIVFEYFNPHFMVTVLFEARGEEIQLDWTMLFDTAEMHDIVVKVHRADLGQQQNVEKLEKYISQLNRATKN